MLHHGVSCNTLSLTKLAGARSLILHEVTASALRVKHKGFTGEKKSIYIRVRKCNFMLNE